MTNLIQTLVTSLLLGGVLALLSSGLTIIFGVMRVVNFAQGELVMLGMYAMVFVANMTGLAYPQLASPLILILFMIGGAILYRLTL